MKKQIFVVGAALLSWSLVGGMHHGLFLSAQEAFRKRLGVSQSQDRNEMISKRNVNNDILLSPKHIQGYIQYEYWKGSNCNDTKTNIHGFQLDHCVLHLSGNGSYEIQISDGSGFELFSYLFNDVISIFQLTAQQFGLPTTLTNTARNI
jgi:hypothetical protein